MRQSECSSRQQPHTQSQLQDSRLRLHPPHCTQHVYSTYTNPSTAAIPQHQHLYVPAGPCANEHLHPAHMQHAHMHVPQPQLVPAGPCANNSICVLLLLLLLQVRAPPLQAAQLSQAELEELLAENAKLKQMLNTYKDRLSPEQVRWL